jgi:hypothetical protein
MNPTRRFKPFWRWEVFLLAMVLVLAMAASIVTRPDWPVVGPVLSIVLLVLAVLCALALVVPLLRPKGRDSEGTLRSLDGVELVPFESLAVQGGSPVPARRLRVVETERRATSIDAAEAKSRALRAVLTPDASRFLGRELRVAVDLVGDDGTVYRAGFVPPDVDTQLNAVLQPLRAAKQAALVPVTISGTPGRRVVEIIA